MTADPLRLSPHEAGHAFAQWTFGRPIVAVSIRPGRSHAGITLVARGEDDHLRSRLDGSWVLDGLDPEARRFADRCIVMVLAGREAEDALGPPRTGYLPELPVHEAPAVPGPLALDSPAAVSLLEAEAHEVEPDAALHDDEAVAFEMAYRLVGMTANAYLGWCRAEARRLMVDHAGPIHALAAALRASQALDGPTAVGIITEALERSTA